MRKNLETVNCNDDAQMIMLGIRPPHLVGRDNSVWTKTPEEKEKLRSIKFPKLGSSSYCEKYIPIHGKLIINVRKNSSKSTYSFDCLQSDIPTILRSLHAYDVAKYSWNGKVYSPEELPFWFKSKRYRNQ